MNMQNLLKKIEIIEKSVFKGDNKKSIEFLGDLANSLMGVSKDMDLRRINLMNEALGLVDIAMKNKDYLLMSDILKYEIIPLLDENFINGGGN
jgi:hypothetical protein